MVNILLFNQYFTAEKAKPDNIVAQIPINLLHLGSYLRSKNLDCRIYELGLFSLKDSIVKGNRIRYGLSDEKIIEVIKTERPKIVGLACMYSRHYIDIISLSRLIKKINPGIHVVLGGNHATDFFSMVLQEPSIDYVVRGEGEITFYELCDRLLSKGEEINDVKGISYRDTKGSIVSTENRELIKNLDDLPQMDYSLVNVKKYINVERPSSFIMRQPSMGITSSRGCPGQCIFCTVKAVWGRSWRGKSPERTVDEIELLHKEYGVREFSFFDDSASANKKRWNAICDEIIRRKLDIRWTTPNGIAHWTLDKPTLKKMKESGCYRITFGIESGCPETREFIRKRHSLDKAKELLQYANKIGMWTICTNILGFPHETKEQIDQTVKFAIKSGTDFATFFLLAPQVTSDVYPYFKKEGLLNFDCIFEANEFNEEEYERMNKILNDGGTPTVNFTSEKLKKIQLSSYRKFIFYRALSYLFPLRIIRKIRSLEDLRYTFRLIRAGVRIFIKSLFKGTTREILHD